jgi:CheY-like chemotaxis protein
MLESREVLLRCIVCRSEKKFTVTLGQKRLLAEGNRLQFQCSYCACPQHWEAARPIEITSRVPTRLTAAQPKSILVVDDDELTVKLLRKVLEAWDAKVEVALNGKEALSKLAAHSFDLLVCDIRMPEMTGQELFKHVQENGYLPPQRVLFLTGDKSAAAKQFLDGSGCYYLYKPLQFLDFSGQVQALLSEEVA